MTALYISLSEDLYYSCNVISLSLFLIKVCRRMPFQAPITATKPQPHSTNENQSSVQEYYRIFQTDPWYYQSYLGNRVNFANSSYVWLTCHRSRHLLERDLIPELHVEIYPSILFWPERVYEASPLRSLPETGLWFSLNGFLKKSD